VIAAVDRRLISMQMRAADAAGAFCVWAVEQGIVQTLAKLPSQSNFNNVRYIE
jgi:hypothetical protein